MAALAVVAMIFIWAIPAVRRHRLRWRLLVACAAIAVAGPILFSELSRPLLDDGPFRGRPLLDCPRGQPSNSLPLGWGLVIESYDASDTQRGAAVRLRD